MRKHKHSRVVGDAENPSRRLVCIVEGHGEVEALPCLCSRVRDYFEAWSWVVDPQPIRQPRAKLVDEKGPPPNRCAHREGLERAMRLAAARPADAVLVICDSDDDCAAAWGASATAILKTRCRGGAVMVVREFEVWLLCSRPNAAVVGGRALDSVRDAKGRLRRIVPGYKPTVHQLQLARTLDIPTVWGMSDSFDKLMRTLAEIFQVEGVTRPLAIDQTLQE